MAVSDKNSINNKQKNPLDFIVSILEGVEIKLCRNNPHAYKPHVHNELSLGYIMEGSTDLTLNNRNIHFNSGDGVIIPPLITHRCAPNDINHWSYVMLYIDPEYYSGKVHFTKTKKLTKTHTRNLIGFFERLFIEKEPDALENILIELLLEFGENEIEEVAAEATHDIVKAIHGYLQSHLNEDITLDKLQQISGLNKFAIIRNFKKLYTTTPAAYHLQCRIAEAKRLLCEGADVFDICDELRFYDQAHLIREFKKMYGLTPGTYIEQVRNSGNFIQYNSLLFS